MLLHNSERKVLLFTVRFWKQWGIDDISFKQYAVSPRGKRLEDSINYSQGCESWFSLITEICHLPILTGDIPLVGTQTHREKKNFPFWKGLLNVSNRSNVQESRPRIQQLQWGSLREDPQPPLLTSERIQDFILLCTTVVHCMDPTAILSGFKSQPLPSHLANDLGKVD